MSARDGYNAGRGTWGLPPAVKADIVAISSDMCRCDVKYKKQTNKHVKLFIKDKYFPLKRVILFSSFNVTLMII